MKRSVIAVWMIIALAAGCGDEDQPAQPPDATALTITLDADGPKGEGSQTKTVACEADAGDSPCAALTVADFAPTPPGVACTEIYGGPDEAEVAGTVDGETVAATFTRGNGCEIERFERLLPLLEELFPGYRPGASLR